MGWEDWKVVRTWWFVHLPVDPAACLRSGQGCGWKTFHLPAKMLSIYGIP